MSDEDEDEDEDEEGHVRDGSRAVAWGEHEDAAVVGRERVNVPHLGLRRVRHLLLRLDHREENGEERHEEERADWEGQRGKGEGKGGNVHFVGSGSGALSSSSSALLSRRARLLAPPASSLLRFIPQGNGAVRVQVSQLHTWTEEIHRWYVWPAIYSR